MLSQQCTSNWEFRFCKMRGDIDGQVVPDVSQEPVTFTPSYQECGYNVRYCLWKQVHKDTVRSAASICHVRSLRIVITNLFYYAVPCIFYYFVQWPINAQLFHKLSRSSYMFRHYCVILREFVVSCQLIVHVLGHCRK